MSKQTTLICLALVVALMVGAFALPVSAASSWMNVRFLRVLVNLIVDGDATVGDDLTVTDSATFGGNVGVGGAADALTALDVTGAAAVSGDLSIGDSVTTVGNVTVGDVLSLEPQAMVTVTDNCTVTVLGSWTVISSAASVGITNIVGISSGALLAIQNVGDYTVTITETNGVISNGGNAVLPPDSIFMGYYDGTKLRGLIDKDN